MEKRRYYMHMKNVGRKMILATSIKEENDMYILRDGEDIVAKFAMKDVIGWWSMSGEKMDKESYGK